MHALSPAPANTRSPGVLREQGPLRRPRRRWLLALLALLLLLALVPRLWDLTHGPDSLQDVVLVGPRGPEAMNVVLVLDESGSFQEYAAIREQAVAQLVGWGRVNLRDDDTLTIVSFADRAGVRLPPTTFARLGSRPALRPVDVGSGTNFQPALTTAASATRELDGAVTLVVLTDTLTSDVGSGAAREVDGLVDRLNATTMTVVVPDDVRVESGWHDVFSWAREVQAGIDSPDQTALAIGEAMAQATGQRLVER